MKITGAGVGIDRAKKCPKFICESQGVTEERGKENHWKVSQNRIQRKRHFSDCLLSGLLPVEKTVKTK
jgi:hypothetical protein